MELKWDFTCDETCLKEAGFAAEPAKIQPPAKVEMGKAGRENS